MEHKSNKKDYLSFSRKSYSIPSQGTNNVYRKRLRSWKPDPIPSKSSSTSIPSTMIDANTISTRKSTIYTFPLRPNTSQSQSQTTNTILSETLTNQSAFYASTVPHPSIRLGDDLNNNHVNTFNDIETQMKNKRKTFRSASIESLTSRSSKSSSMEIITEPISNDNLQLICPRTPAKRSRISSDHSKASSIESDPCTIDINQRDIENSSTFSFKEKLPMNNSTAIVNAVKMVQPIVDIIFNAFENQLRTNETKTIQPHISYPIYSPLMMSSAPTRSSTRPITLHAVHFNIQLTADQHQQQQQQQQQSKVSIVDVTSSPSPSSSTSKTTDETLTSGNRLKQMIQLALVGVSVICGYWLL